MLAVLQLNYSGKAYKWASLALLSVCLLLLGSHEQYLKELCRLAITQVAETVSYHYLQLILKYCSQIINMFYRVGYLALCLLIIYAYFRDGSVTALALYLFGGLLLFTLLLYSSGKMLGSSALHIAAYRVDALLISPMPIVLLIPALKLVAKPNTIISQSNHTTDA